MLILQVKKTSKQSVKIPLTKEGFLRLTSGHPWIFDRQLSSEHKWPQVPAILPLGEHLFLYSPKAEIRLRRLGPSGRHFFGADFKELLTDLSQVEESLGPQLELFLKEALDRRVKLLPHENCYRWVFSETDYLPGLIVDRFDDLLSVQIQTAPMEFLWPLFKKLLTKVFENRFNKKLRHILEVRSSSYRKKEGLQIEESRQDEKELRALWNGLEWNFHPGGGQKTGSYFDQALNHKKAQTWAQSLGLKSAWDLCSFEGGFGLHLAKAGLEVLAVDISARALEGAQANAELNKIPPSLYRTQEADVFDFLKSAHEKQNKTEVIVLDPPSFLKSKAHKESASRAFKELNLRAMHCVKPGGLLVSCVCSQNMDPQSYSELLRSAGHDTRREIRVLERAGPSPDHAPLTNFPESNYLQAWYLWIS